MITITLEFIRAAAEDAANRQMRKEDRRTWNEDDYRLACETFERICKENKLP